MSPTKTKPPASPARWLFAACALLFATAAAAGDAASLRQEIEAADRALFAAVFDACDADAVAAMVADDLEFFHDKWGQIARSGVEFVAAIRGACERQRAGTDFKARRTLLPESSVVHPMNKYGALHTGSHAFFRVEADGSLVPTESAQFANLWRLQEGRWLLARVFSYDHVDAPAGKGK